MIAGVLDAALRAAAAGWWVFPIRPGGKTPAAPAAHRVGTREAQTCRGRCGRWGHGLHDATLDPERIAAAWRRWPKANLGISCGPSRLVVIDLDTTPGLRPDRVLREQPDDEPTPSAVRDAGSALTWLGDRHGGAPDDLDTLTVDTPTGGRHLYYEAPGGGLRVTSGAGLTSGLGWGIDVRAHGGYVVAPPSTRPQGPYTTLGGRLRPLPAWLLDALTAAGRVSTPSPDGRARRPRPHGAPSVAANGYVAAAIHGELERISRSPVGALNDAVTRAAFAVGQVVAGQAMDGGVAEALLGAARQAGARHAATGGKPFNEAKTAATIARAMAAGEANPRSSGR